ncbi:hypothetical protein GCM10027186_15370 [Micromonospora schwarzwaldensis]
MVADHRVSGGTAADAAAGGSAAPARAARASRAGSLRMDRLLRTCRRWATPDMRRFKLMEVNNGRTFRGGASGCRHPAGAGQRRAAGPLAARGRRALAMVGW